MYTFLSDVWSGSGRLKLAATHAQQRRVPGGALLREPHLGKTASASIAGRDDRTMPIVLIDRCLFSLPAVCNVLFAVTLPGALAAGFVAWPYVADNVWLGVCLDHFLAFLIVCAGVMPFLSANFLRPAGSMSARAARMSSSLGLAACVIVIVAKMLGRTVMLAIALVASSSSSSPSPSSSLSSSPSLSPSPSSSSSSPPSCARCRCACPSCSPSSPQRASLRLPPYVSLSLPPC